MFLIDVVYASIFSAVTLAPLLLGKVASLDAVLMNWCNYCMAHRPIRAVYRPVFVQDEVQEQQATDELRPCSQDAQIHVHKLFAVIPKACIKLNQGKE